MKRARLIMISLAMAAAVATPTLLHIRGQVLLRAHEKLLQQRMVEVKRFSTDNGLLSNILAKTQSPESLSDAELSELLRLRNEAG